MDQKRLLLAISISLAILVLFQVIADHFVPHRPLHLPNNPNSQAAQVIREHQSGAPVSQPPGAPVQANNVQPAKAKAAPRLVIDAPAVSGSMSLLGAKLDDLVLRNYHLTVKKDSPLVRLLSRSSGSKPYYVQFGWNAAPGESMALPGSDTLWKASAPVLSPGHPVTLSWNNGGNVIFKLVMHVDDRFMFTVQQVVDNKSGKPVSLFPWSRIRRDYLPAVPGIYILHKGPLGVFNHTLHEVDYADMKSQGKRTGTAYHETSQGGWLGITGKYWLTALIPDQSAPMEGAYRYLPRADHPGDYAYQTDFMNAAPVTAAPGAASSTTMRVFTGAKVLKTLNAYGAQYNIPSFDKAIDFGWFYFLTKPIFLMLDWLNARLGNFGLAIIVFTFFAKLVLSPLAVKSYRSMAKMRSITPKVQAVRERFKGDQTKQQQETMALYKAEGVNPVAGCLPMLVQVPIFFALYKVIFITIEMRHAPFFGWLQNLAAEDPTNVFNLFGLLPFHPGLISPFLHIGVLPLILGLTNWGQMQLNPTPPDPMQARMMQFMPIIYTVMLARFPAGLVLYYIVNNLLTITQQWVIMRHAMAPRRTELATKT
jgi:YidC/Oxa1 family membrane protein insertase